MKILKASAFSVMAAALLMVFAGSSSAATYTSPTGTAYTGSVSSSLEGSALLEAGGEDEDGEGKGAREEVGRYDARAGKRETR